MNRILRWLDPGPIFWWELTRLSRRAALFWWRLIILGSLFLGLLIVYLRRFPLERLFRLTFADTIPINEMASLAQDCVVSVLVMQLVVILLMVPIYFGVSVREDLDKSRYIALLMTQQSDHGIVLAQFLARFVHLAGMVAIGIPVLVLTAFFGGVELHLLLEDYALIFASTGFYGALSIYLAFTQRSMIQTLLFSYLLLIVTLAIGLCCVGMNPFALIVMRRIDSDYQYQTLTQLLLYLVGIALLLVETIPLVRPALFPNLPDNTLEVATSPASGKESIPELVKNPWRWIPEIDEERPVLWKEIHFDNRPWWSGSIFTRFVLLMVVWYFGASLVISITKSQIRGNGYASNASMHHQIGIAVGLILLSVGSSIAVSLSSERNRNTLDSLLMLPIDRSEILRAKIVGCWWNYGWVLISSCILIVVHCIVWRFPWMDALILLLFVLGMLLLSTTFGIWLAVRCHQGYRAALWLMGAVILWCILPILLGELIPILDRELSLKSIDGEQVGRQVRSLSLAEIWESLNRDPVDRDLFPVQISLRQQSVIALMVIYLLSVQFFWLAQRNFEREGKR